MQFYRVTALFLLGLVLTASAGNPPAGIITHEDDWEAPVS